MGAVLLTLMLAALDMTIVGTAMPSIIRDLHGFDRYAWVTSAYMLTSTLAVPVVGRLSDMYGRKWFFIGATFVFLVTSALCGASGDLPLPLDGMDQLILFRGLQGGAGGSIVALSFVVLGDAFPPRERGRWQGVLGSVFGLASIVGPPVGGWITMHYSWRWVFYVNAPLAVLALVVLYVTFPSHVSDGRRHRIDFAGIVALAAFVVPLLIGLTAGGRKGWTDPAVVATLVFSLAMLALFIVIERRAAEPVLPPKLFQERVFLICAASTFCTAAAMFCVIVYIPLYLQGVLALSAVESGYLFTPLMVMAVVGSNVAGQLMSRTGRYREVSVIGAAILLCGQGMMVLFGVDTTRSWVIASLVVAGLGTGATQPGYVLIVQNTTPAEHLGVSTATIKFFRSIGGTMGVALFGTVLLTQYTAHMAPVLAQVPPALRQHFTDPLTLAQAGPAVAEPAQYEQWIAAARSALAGGLHSVFILSSLMLVIVVLLNFGIPRIDTEPLHPPEPHHT